VVAFVVAVDLEALDGSQVVNLEHVTLLGVMLKNGRSGPRQSPIDCVGLEGLGGGWVA
jgi:hypothetical protein